MSIDYFYPQRMGRIILQAMEEVMGRKHLDAVLAAASRHELVGSYPPDVPERTFPFESVSGLHLALEKAYGTRSGRGLAVRIGRASFAYGLRHYGVQLGISDPGFRLLPLPARLQAGVRSFAELFNHHTDQVVQVQETDEHILWNIERCPLCWGRKAEEPVCHLAVGLLQESLYWLSGGKIFEVEETHCIARDDAACRVRIVRQPLA
jgi:predicted hydrocarbon binding protein